jgi:hypothetical protein
MVDFAFYYGMNIIFSKMTITVKGEGGILQVSELIERISLLQNHLRIYYVPISTGIFLFFGLVLWLYLKAVLKKIVSQDDSGNGKEKAASAD